MKSPAKPLVVQVSDRELVCYIKQKLTWHHKGYDVEATGVWDNNELVGDNVTLRGRTGNLKVVLVLSKDSMPVFEYPCALEVIGNFRRLKGYNRTVLVNTATQTEYRCANASGNGGNADEDDEDDEDEGDEDEDEDNEDMDDEDDEDMDDEDEDDEDNDYYENGFY